MANLVELFDNIVQMQALNGVPLANGKLYVYALGRTRLMDTWSDVDGESLNTNPIILDDAGQAHCYVSDDFDYTLVVCDAYNNEVFSIDKYLYSKGEHSHADVAVAPSEHIGVSSYHVGETTVYVPYIQGELGKTYHGIEPIVVNNQENKISARNIPLGVQEPLYFVEDSESACVIGMSGEYQPITGMSGYATTGDLVDMAESISETYQPKGDYATVDDLTGFMEESKLETADGKITGYDGTAFAGGGSVDPSEFIPWSASGNFATSGDLNDKLDTTAFSTVSGDFITAVPDSYATKDFVSSSVSSKLDSTAFADVSGNFITALPEGILNESGFEYDGDKISAYNGSAFVGQGGGGITGEYELSAGNGISIDNYPIEQKTVISVTGNYATEQWVQDQGYLTAETDWSDTITAASANAYNEATAAIPAPFDPTYLSGQIDNKLDSAIYAADSGNFLTAHQSLADYQTIAGMTAYQSAGDYYSASNPSGFITGVDLTPYQTVEGMTAYQPVGDYLTTGDSAEFYTTANESGFITGVDLTPYQLTADMTAYQPAGDYLTTADSANFYTTANESGYITGVPDTYLQNTDLTIADNKVTEISGIPLSAGTELEFEYDAADNISAINNSAISTTPAQALYAKSPLYFDVTGTSSYMGINSADLARMLGVDETVLFSGSTQSPNLTDSIWNYKKILLLIGDDTNATKVSNSQMYYTDDIAAIGSGFSIFQTCKRYDGGYISMAAYINVNNGGSGFTVASVGGWASWDNSTCQYNGAGTWAPRFYKVIGIGRKEV